MWILPGGQPLQSSPFYSVNAVGFNGVRRYQKSMGGAVPQARCFLGSIDFRVSQLDIANYNTRQLFSYFPYGDVIDDGGDIFDQTNAILQCGVYRIDAVLTIFIYVWKNNGSTEISDLIGFTFINTTFDAWHNLIFHINIQTGVFEASLDGVVQTADLFDFGMSMQGDWNDITVGSYIGYLQGSDYMVITPFKGAIGECWLHHMQSSYSGSVLIMQNNRMTSSKKPKSLGAQGQLLTGSSITPLIYLRLPAPNWKDNQGSAGPLFLHAGTEATTVSGPVTYGVA